MKSKQSGYALSGLVVGVVVGLLAGASSLTMIKKSQRAQMLWISMGVCVVAFGAIGYSKGASFGKEADIENIIGMSDAEDSMYQVGRAWIETTKWTNKIDNTDYELITGQAQEKTLISQLNNKLIFNHAIKSGSKVNVSKYHKAARDTIFKQQKQQAKGLQ